MATYNPTNHRHRRPSFKLLGTVLVLIVVLVIASIAYHIHSVHIAQHTSGTVASVHKSAAATKTSTDKQQNSPNTTGQSDTVADNSSKTTGNSMNLETPFGTFVSNHSPGADGSPTTEASSCNTTPGATCDIVFTNNGGVSKDLGAKTADGSGAAYWSWDIKGANLASGDWQISAVAKLNGQTQTATDTLKLKVQ